MVVAETYGTHTVLRTRLVVTIDGVPTEVFGADAQHGVNQPIGTASITLPLPLPDHLRGADNKLLNKPIEIKAGHDETAIRTIFVGRIDADRMTINEKERTATINARGPATLLDWPEDDDLVFNGPIALHDIARSLCTWRGMKSFRIDPINTHEGGPALLGGNANIDEGKVTIPKRTSPLSWLDRKCRLYGYRIFDTPSGELRIRRVSGLPQGAVSATYTEAVNAFTFQRTRDLKPMVTYWTIEGATYTDADGVRIPVRSFPAGVPGQPMLTPPGYRADRISDNDIVTTERAHTIRYVQEIDSFQPYHELRWEAVGDAWRQPGEAVQITVPTFDVGGKYWLMSIDQRIDGPEYNATMAAWAGGSTSLPSGDDLVTVNVGTGPYHVGDEYLSHYAVPSPNGTTVTLNITVPDEYTSIAISGRGHGVNSYLLDGGNAESSVSKIEVWQNGEEVGSAELPVMPENLLQALPYSNDAHWQSFRMPVPGRLEPGPAQVRIVAGEDSRAMAHTKIDDFEVKALIIELRGVGRSDLPTQGGA